jgi:hypothetical protein
VEGDPVRAEQSPAIDRGAHRELAGDEDPHGRRDSDARAGVGDREDDQQPHQAAEQHPPRLMDGTGEAGEALVGQEEDHDRDSRRQRRGEGKRLEHADALAEPRHERDLHRAGEAGRHGQPGRKRASGHG